MCTSFNSVMYFMLNLTREHVLISAQLLQLTAWCMQYVVTFEQKSLLRKVQLSVFAYISELIHFNVAMVSTE